MLRTYVLHPEFYADPSLAGRELANFGDLLRALDKQVTIVVPDPDLEAFVRLTRNPLLGARAEVVVERVLSDLAASGPALVRYMPDKERTALERAKRGAIVHQADAIVVRASTSTNSRGIPWLGLEQVALDIESEGDSVALDGLMSESGVDELLARFFLRDDHLVVVDPYLGKNVLLEAGNHRFRKGLLKLLKLWTLKRPKLNPEPCIVFLLDRRKSRLGDRYADAGLDIDAIHRALEQLLVTALGPASGPPVRPRIELRVHHDFTMRGMRSSKRDWYVDHNIEELGGWLDYVQAGRGARNTPRVPSVQLLERAKSNQLDLLRRQSELCGSVK
jgi:hypothetical protein